MKCFGKVRLLLNHWLFLFIIHTKQQWYIEVQFKLENTYLQVRVWLQKMNENDPIILRERRKYKKTSPLYLTNFFLDNLFVVALVAEDL